MLEEDRGAGESASYSISSLLRRMFRICTALSALRRAFTRLIARLAAESSTGPAVAVDAGSELREPRRSGALRGRVPL